MLLTVDSSVFVAALRIQEIYHRESLRILEQIRDGQHLAVQPFTVLVEVVAAIRRRTGSQELAGRVRKDFLTFDFMQFVELDSHRADAAGDIAMESGLRGMDAIVVQVAREFGSSLVSLDDEMLERARNLVTTKRVIDF